MTARAGDEPRQVGVRCVLRDGHQIRQVLAARVGYGMGAVHRRWVPPQSAWSPVNVPATSAARRCRVASPSPSTAVPMPIPLSVTSMTRSSLTVMVMASSSAWECRTALPTASLSTARAVSYTHLRAHETDSYLVCRLLLDNK